jgi:hypothetical protein
MVDPALRVLWPATPIYEVPNEVLIGIERAALAAIELRDSMAALPGAYRMIASSCATDELTEVLHMLQADDCEWRARGIRDLDLKVTVTPVRSRRRRARQI